MDDSTCKVGRGGGGRRKKLDPLVLTSGEVGVLSLVPYIFYLHLAL